MKNLLSLVLCLTLFPAAAQAQLSTSGDAQNVLVQARATLAETYAGKLETLAAQCEAEGLEELAEFTRSWVAQRAKDKIYVAVLPDMMEESLLEEGASDAELAWEKKFTALRKAQAAELFKLSRRVVKAKHASLGFDVLMDTLREDPDHKAARKIVGYVAYKNQWCTPFDAQQLRAGKVDHPRFGWIPKAHVKKYEEGQRYVNKRWVPAEDEAAVRRTDIHKGWVVETAYYQIQTNHSLEAGVKLGRDLEKLYRVWKQLFLRYFASEAQVAAMFDGKNAGLTAPAKHKVLFFRSRDDYNRYLKPKNPGIERSLGLYATGEKTAYFFAGKDYDPRTMFHEATHQLFAEIRNVSKQAGFQPNFWLTEGIAMYMETLHDEDGSYVVGGFSDDRVLVARYHYLVEKFYVPIKNLCAMDADRFQGDPQVSRLYSQSAALMHFLVYYKDGIYRDAMVECLSDVYAGRSTLQLLPRRLGKTFEQLDKEYEEFISQNKEELKKWTFSDRE